MYIVRMLYTHTRYGTQDYMNGEKICDRLQEKGPFDAEIFLSSFWSQNNAQSMPYRLV